MKKVRILWALLFCALLLSGCGVRRLQEVRVSSARIVRLLPAGPGGPSALVEIGISNPAVAFEVSDLEGRLRYKGGDLLLLSAEPFFVAARSDSAYTVPVQGRFAEDVNPLRIVRLISGNGLDYNDMTVSLRGRVNLRGKIGKDIELEDVPLRTLLERIERIRNENE